MHQAMSTAVTAPSKKDRKRQALAAVPAPATAADQAIKLPAPTPYEISAVQVGNADDINAAVRVALSGAYDALSDLSRSVVEKRLSIITALCTRKDASLASVRTALASKTWNLPAVKARTSEQKTLASRLSELKAIASAYFISSQSDITEEQAYWQAEIASASAWDDALGAARDLIAHHNEVERPARLQRKVASVAASLAGDDPAEQERLAAVLTEAASKSAERVAAAKAAGATGYGDGQKHARAILKRAGGDPLAYLYEYMRGMVATHAYACMLEAIEGGYQFPTNDPEPTTTTKQ